MGWETLYIVIKVDLQIFSFQSGLAETLNQGSAYLSSVTEAAATAVSSAAASATSAPAAATAANVGHRGG